MNHEELKKFLKAANKATYANKNATKSSSLRPSSEDYHFEQDNLVFHDTYFGSRDFIGEEMVYKNGKPIWGMNYCGFVTNPEISTEEAYSILRPALMQEYDDILPVRGPKEFVLENNKYTNKIEGTLDRFLGEENIYINDELVYRCWYHGGLIS